MTETQQTNPTLAPHLVCAGAAEAIDFYQRAFGAEEMMRLEGADGNIMHAGLTINGAVVMLADEQLEHGLRGPHTIGGSPVTLNLGVDDADAWAERAVAAGASLAMPVEEQFWGDRYGVVVDPFGHSWALVTPVREMSVEDVKAAAPAAM